MLKLLMTNVTLFSEIIGRIPREIIKKQIRIHQTDKHSKGFNTWDHLVSMIFCQFSNSVSLREISNGLHSANGNLNHLWLLKAPSKSTLSYRNEKRDCTFFRDCYYELFNYFGQQGVFNGCKSRFKNKVKLLDSSTIVLCAAVYDWARYTKTKGAVKLQTLLDFDTLLPEIVNITDGKIGDNTAAKEMNVKPGNIVVADRGYFDTGLLNDWDSRGVFFVVRNKGNIQFEVIRDRDLPEIHHQNVLLDQEVYLVGKGTSKQYSKPIRRIVVWNDEYRYAVEIVTNNFKLAASNIAALYKARWKIETFFRTIKQNFHIKSFVGTSANAVEIQIWTALITILLFAYLKFIAKYNWNFSNLVASLRLNTFTKMDLNQWLDEPFTPPPDVEIAARGD